DARIVTTFGYDLGLVAVAIDGLARGEDRRGRFDRKACHDRLPGGDAAEDAAGVVGEESRPAVIAHAHLVGVVLTRECRRGKARTDLHALDRVDAHERAGEIAVELAIDRCAEAWR